ncbi:unnamed protein product [Ambrosiozyma monospora]|uniref:Unnamed protein product n=1 Tax=Ambrosiozyma monospora TaxID=43982 RepID=A0A9W6Z2D2_AMBMO|nr:unnamed protein product [Ambrosiozyma monospora]
MTSKSAAQGRATLSEADKKLMNIKLGQLLDEVYLLRDENDVDFNHVFHTLPLRSNVEYYKVIKRPMSYSKIRQLVKHFRYTNPQAFINDMTQISWNARLFNEDGSLFFKWAEVLNVFIKETVIPTIRNDPKIHGHESVDYPYLGPLPSDDPSMLLPAPVQEQESISGTANGTPVPSSLQGSQSPVAYASTPVGSVAHTPIAPVSVSPVINGTAQLATVVQQTTGNTPASTTHEDNYEADETKAAEDEDDDYEETTHHTSYNKSGIQQHSSGITYNYSPTTYVARIEDSGIVNMYTPPRTAGVGISNIHTLEQWVKRGRPPIVDKPHEQRIKSIMRGLKKIKVNGKTIITVFDKLPSAQEHPRYYEVVTEPKSMLDIKGLIKQRFYTSVDHYMSDVVKLIENNKKYYTEDQFMKDNIALLESNVTKLYHEEMKKPDSDYIGDAQSTKIPIPYLARDGRSYKVGSWVLLKNPNDDARPIIGQIFRIWQEHGRQFVNVCWYYRPEWTTHRSDRLFLENEVFKTGQYRDHPVESILGPCYVAYFTRWVKGDPAVPYEGPLFVCEFRYNDRDQIFNKIRTWKACLPDEVRHIEDPIKQLNKPRVLKKYPSPIKHLLSINASATDPIPTPTILDQDAPPLVGAVFRKRLDDDDDANYFDETLSATQFKSYIPPTNMRLASTTIGESSGTATPQPPVASSPVATPHAQFATFHQPLQTGHIPVISGIPTSTLNTNAAAAAAAHAVAVAHQQQQQQQQIQHQQQLASRYQTQNYYNGNGYSNQAMHSYSGGGGHKIVHSSFNNLTYQFSQFHQATYSQAFVLPSNREQGLQKFVRKLLG